MRLEATIPAPRALQLQQLATELNISKSDLVAEALTILLAAATECRHGRRLAFVDVARKAVRELAIPSLSQLEWTANHQERTLSEPGQRRAHKVLKTKARPKTALRKAFAAR
jgi:hypothetical protein